MKSCWQKSKVDPNVVAAETYLATVFDSCVAEYPLSPFAAVSPHKSNDLTNGADYSIA